MYSHHIETLLPDLPHMSFGELTEGSVPPYSINPWAAYNKQLDDWMGNNSDSGNVINMIAAGGPIANLVTGESEGDRRRLITDILQNDVQRSALAQLDREQQKEHDTQRVDGEREARLADLEAYSRAHRGLAIDDDNPYFFLQKVAVFEPDIQENALHQQYEQGRHDLFMGGVSPMQEIASPVQQLTEELPACQISLTPKQEPAMSTPSRLGLSAASLAAASQLGAAINQFASCRLVAANSISAPQSAGFARGGNMLARAA